MRFRLTQFSKVNVESIATVHTVNKYNPIFLFLVTVEPIFARNQQKPS